LEPMALQEEGHSGKALFPECNTRGRETLADEKSWRKMNIFYKGSSLSAFP
jgi:hypothetical protein